MKKYRKITTVEAIQWNGENDASEIISFTEGKIFPIISLSGETKYFVINTLEGTLRVEKGDYIIKGINGEFYPCKPDIFKKTYKEVTEND